MDLYGKCPYATAQRMLQGKWTILIMHHLEAGPVRFNELQRRLPQMTHATLSKQLKQMEADGLIRRTEVPGKVLHVEYELADLGRAFAPVLAEIKIWGTKAIARMNAEASRSTAQPAREKPLNASR